MKNKTKKKTIDKRESRPPAMTIEKVFRSRGLEGSYSIEEITAYVESLKRESRGTCGCCANGAPFDRCK